MNAILFTMHMSNARHSFLLAALTAVIAVRGLAAQDSTALADSAFRKCHAVAASAQEDCYDGFLVPLVAARGVPVAMATLDALGARDAQVRIDGHVYAHAIGIAAGRGAGGGHGDVARVFAGCTEIFQSGCYHGVIQAYFERVRAVDTASVNALCSAFTAPSASQWLRFQCVHGMGHGLTMVYGHDLPRALTGCDLLRAQWDRESCYGGAFMENVVNATEPQHAAHMLHSHADMQMTATSFKPLDAANLQYPCSIMAQRYLVACYNMQPSVMLYFSGGNIPAAARACLDAPPALRPECHQGLGREISAYSRQDHAVAIGMCGSADPAYRSWCHVGVVKNLIDLTARYQDGLAYCRAVTGSDNQRACYEAVGEEIGTLRQDMTQRAAACAEVEPAYREACRWGARVPGARATPLAH